mgnify:CR=1 FL=1
MFHAVSAFCNAGFSLVPDSLERFSSNPPVVFTIALLVILGGISFSVMTDLSSTLFKKIKSLVTGKHSKNTISTNSRTVLDYTLFLIIAGMFTFYFFEHGNVMKGQMLPHQYLSAFFQSVTLRTAGFNTIPFSSLAPVTLFIMILFMFTGGAAGSTAGGIKINTLAVIVSYLKSISLRRKNIIIYDRQLPLSAVLKAFSVLALALASVAGGFIILLASEKAPPLDLLFETVSAFATVGLSTGVTPDLSYVGKAVIIVLMFAGRLGPLAIIASLVSRQQFEKSVHSFPEADILIG